MTASLIDPRPLQPVDPPADFVQWKIVIPQWNKGVKTTIAIEESGTTPQMLEAIALQLHANCDGFWVEINAENACWDYKLQEPYYFSLSYPSNYPILTDWTIKEGGEIVEQDYDNDELFGWIEYKTAENKSFVVEIDQHDPTP